jgi:hypothetical protein
LPTLGVYLNEADIQEPNWQTDFYGAKHYPKLLALKKKWDPKDVFCQPGTFVY